MAIVVDQETKLTYKEYSLFPEEKKVEQYLLKEGKYFLLKKCTRTISFQGLKDIQISLKNIWIVSKF